MGEENLVFHMLIFSLLCQRVNFKKQFEKQQFRILVVFPPIYVLDTKIIYGYNFVAPLSTWFSLFCLFLLVPSHLQNFVGGKDN